jgi:acetylglutamate kinase
MNNKISIVKIGGNIINDEEQLDTFLADFAKIKGPKILVHGGGVIATEFNERLGNETSMVNGRRVTSSEDLDMITMVYAGLLNKKIVSKLQGYNCNALGLTGADANSIIAVKRPAKPIDFGWVGDVKEVNGAAIDVFLQNHMTPVFCAVSHDGKGQLFNTNADTVATEIAIGMSAIYEAALVFCFEKKGVLRDVNDDESVIQQIDMTTYEELKSQGIISKGMLPKMENSFHALKNGVSKVIIGDPAVLQYSAGSTTVTL